MIKKILYTLLFLVCFLFTSCWIYPDYKNYLEKDGVLYFEDYETMKSVIIPQINKSFTAWHWSGDQFDKKYQQYFGNVVVNDADYQYLVESNYIYAVRNLPSAEVKFIVNGKVQENKTKIGECYWITTSNNQGVIFYQN